MDMIVDDALLPTLSSCRKSSNIPLPISLFALLQLRLQLKFWELVKDVFGKLSKAEILLAF